MKHSCILISPRETDYIAGQNSPIVFKAAVTSGDWTDHIDFFEKQKLSFETDACVFFAGQESFDAQMNDQIENGQIPQWLIDQFTTLGYMDPNSLDGKPRFHSSPRFLHVLANTRFNGASLPTVWDTMRKYGILPWKDMPFDELMGPDQYFAEIAQEYLDKAKQFLALIGGKNSIQYHWVVNGGANNIAAMKAALPQAPLCLGAPVCEPWDQEQPPTCSLTNPQHSTMVYKIDQFVEDFDHYIPFLKRLAFDYPIPYALQGILTVTPTLPVPAAPVLPPNPTKPQISSWLNQLKQWLITILNNLKGRQNLGSEPMTSKIFNLQLNDFEKGLIVAIFSPALLQIAAICNAITTSQPIPTIDWNLLVKVSIASGAGYLVKNLLSNSQGQFLQAEPK